MRTAFKVAMLASVLAMLAPPPGAAAERFDPSLCALSGAAWGRTGSLPEMRLVLRDGRNGFAPVPMAGAALSGSGGGYASAWRDSSGRVSYTCTVTKSAEGVKWTLQVKNDSAGELWLDVRLQAALDAPRPSFWDGRELHAGLAQKFVRTDFAGTFPMTCAWGGKSGLAIGMDPQQIVSWLEEGCDPGAGVFWQGTRLVVWAGGEESVSFLALPFSPDYGYFSALQAFYDAFPVSMSPWPGTDPRLRGGYDGGVVNHEIKDEYVEPEYSSQEFARRSRTDWDWFFRPAKFNFFVLDRPEYWEGTDRPYAAPAGFYGVDVPGWEGGSEREYTLARNAWLTEHGEAMGIASMYYILSHGDRPLVEKYGWLESNAYAKEDVKDGFPTVGDWGGLPERGSRRLFPGAGAPAETLKKDLAEVLKTYPVRGFAWDSNRVDAVFRQPELIKACPRPAFDEKGPFVQDAVGYAMIIDYVHSLRLPDGAAAGMASNLGPPRESYLISLRADTTISEMLVVNVLSDVEGFEHDRIMRGRRSKSQLSGMWRDPIGNHLNWGGMSPLEIREALRSLHSQFLLLCLKLGIYPEPDSCFGYEKTMRYLPAIDAATRAGWEPVCAMRGPEGLWLSRFGKGPETILTLGNPLDGVEVPAGRVTLECGRAGLSGCVLSEFFGRPLDMKTSGATTEFQAALAEGDPLVLRAVGTLSVPARLQTSAEYRADGAVYTWRALEPVKAEAVAFAPAGMRAQSVTVAGRRAAFTPVKGGIAFSAALGAGQSIQVTFASESIRVPQSRLFAFPFVNGALDAAACAIVLPEKPTRAQQHAAGRLREYFRFYCASARDWDPLAPRGREVLIPIVSESQASGYPAAVRIGGAESGVSLSPGGRTLLVGRSGGLDEAAVMDGLLRALDAKYPYTGRICCHIAKAMMRGMANKQDTWRDIYAGRNYQSTREMLRKAGVLYGVLTEKEEQR